MHACMYVRVDVYMYVYINIHMYMNMYTIHTYINIYIYGHALRGPPPPPNGLGSRPPSVVWVAFPPCGVGSGILHPPVVWGLAPPSLWCGAWWGRVRAGKSWWGGICGPSKVGSPSGREASLARQTIFCGRRFCSETLGCPFRCFSRPWRFLLGIIQYRAI